ncbi:MAG: gluconokinase, partial [Anaerolineales bacterium]|nr:gluconokinase [Anaerolineales bacterium]
MADPTASIAGAAAATPWVLAIDIGTSSTRALLYDARGRAVDGLQAQSTSELRTGQDGSAELDPEATLAGVALCIDAVLAQAGSRADAIGAVALDTLATTFLAVDAAGRPLTALTTYADTRSARAALELQAQLDEAEVHERTGCLLRASYWPARLAWLRHTRPEVWRRAARWMTFGEFLELRWFGRSRVSYSAASWTGLLERGGLRWDAPLLAHLEVDAQRLSPLVDVDEPLTELTAPFAARWPQLSGIPWFPAIGDGAAANVGSGCVGPDRIALTLGTTGAIRVARARVDRVPKGLWCYRIDRKQALLGGATSEGGNVYAWLQQLLRLGDPAEVEAIVAAYPPDGHGLTVLPFVAGERSPGWAGDVPATLHGLTLATTPIAIVRAGLEAVAFRFAAIGERLGIGAAPDQRVIASGSALRYSPAWAQIFADVLGRPVVLSAEGEATSRGAAVLALQAMGLTPDPAADGPVREPNAESHARYQTA